MKIKYTENAIKDTKYWRKKNDAIYKKIKTIIDDIIAHPFSGIGKPEPLRYDFSGRWSRRITGEHRIVYAVKGKEIIIYQCRYHYKRFK